MKNKIDYSLIWKYFNATLNNKEQEELNQWLQEDKSHQAYFEKLKSRQQQKEVDYVIKDSQNAWEDIRLTSKQNKNYKWQFGVAASFIFIVLAYFGYIYFKPNSQDLIPGNEIRFEPGEKRATLVLDNGERLDLDSKKDTLIKEAATVIRNKESQLNYQPVVQAKREDKKVIQEKFNTLIVPRGGEYNLLLSDGTEIKINSESILKYPVKFTKGHRHVQLIGEAFFNVKTDSLSPFIVASGKHIVKVYGTSFNIKSYQNEDKIITTLVEGKVSVSDNLKNVNECLLEPGYQSIYKKSSPGFELQKVDINQFVSWKDGRFYFRNMRLDEMTNILGRWYNVEFEFKNKEAKNLRFNGNLKRYENIQTILNQLRKTNEITFTAYEEIIYVN